MRGPPAPPPRHPTLAHALLAAATHPSGVTFVDLREREVRLGWDQVVARARAAGARFRAWGVAPGDRVAIVLRTEPAFLDAFFGAWLAGAVPVPLYPPVRLGRLEEYRAATARMLALSGARLVVSGGGTLRLLGEVVERAALPLGCRDAAELTAGMPPARHPAFDPGPLAPPGALGLIQFSSGSTVEPKPVALTHAALQAQVDALTVLVAPVAADVLVSWLPLYHDMGLLGGLLGAMSYPGPLVLIPPEHFLARPALWLRAVARHRGTISPAPSFAYAYCADRVDAADLAGLDLRSWRLALDGAEPISGEALRRFAARFAPHGFDPRSLVPVYGLSEAALAVTFARPGVPLRGRHVDAARMARDGLVVDGDREVVPVGTPVPGVAVEVRDQQGRPLGEDRLGRIWVSGPALFAGYFGDGAATAKALVDGWLDTGDLGFWSGGQLHVHGRAKDLVIIRGANHAPEEFEESLTGLEGLRPGCAVALGRPEPDGGESLLILAERSRERNPDGDAELEEAVRRGVLRRTGIAPAEVRLLAPGTLPRTSSGKLRRQEALRRSMMGDLTEPTRVGPLSLALAAVRSRLALERSRRGRPV